MGIFLANVERGGEEKKMATRPHRERKLARENEKLGTFLRLKK